MPGILPVFRPGYVVSVLLDYRSAFANSVFYGMSPRLCSTACIREQLESSSLV